jgi:DNA-binding transcriptional MerR regulator
MEWLTVGDVARALDVAAETIRLWDRLGKLPATVRTESGIRLFRREDVERFAKERSAKQRMTA